MRIRSISDPFLSGMREKTMIIVSKDGKKFINMDNVVMYTINEEYIQAHCLNGATITVGKYGSADEATEALRNTLFYYIPYAEMPSDE